MDSLIDAIVEGLFKSGIPEDILVIILILGFAYFTLQRFIVSINDKVDSVPNKDYHTEKELIRESNRRDLNKRLDAIEANLNNIQISMLDSDFNNKLLIKETENINSEIKEIRSIISQFQNQMIYSKSDIFGNREIK